MTDLFYFSGCLAWSDELKLLAVGNLHDSVEIYNIDDASLNPVTVIKVPGSGKELRQIDFTLRGSLLAIGGMHGAVELWSLPDGLRVEKFVHTKSKCLLYINCKACQQISEEQIHAMKVCLDHRTLEYSGAY